MSLQHVNVKIFVDGELNIKIEDLVKLFHRWVSEQSMPEMMVDVADYMHVPDGPGIVLVGHEADYSLDFTAGRAGLRYNYKAKREGSSQDNLRHAFECATQACAKLEGSLSGLTFDRTQLQVVINDRAIAPNTEETRTVFADDFAAFAAEIGGSSADITYESNPRRLFGAHIKLANAFEVAAIA
jgi:hypothetical protein